MKILKSLCLFLLFPLFFSCKYFNQDLPAYLEYYTSEACIAKHEIISEYISEDSPFNKCGFDCVNPSCSIRFFLRNPQGYDLQAVTDDPYFLPSCFTQSGDKRFLYYSNTLQEDSSLSESIGLKALLPGTSDFRSMQEIYDIGFMCDTQPPLAENLQICFKDNGNGTRDYYLCFIDTVAKNPSAFANVNEIYINNTCYDYSNLPSDRFFTDCSDDLYLFYDAAKSNPFTKGMQNQLYYLIEQNVADGSDFCYTAYVHYEDPYLKGNTAFTSMASGVLSDIVWSKTGGANKNKPLVISSESGDLISITISHTENATVYVTVKDLVSNEEKNYQNNGSVTVSLDKGNYSIKAYARKPGYVDTPAKEYFYKINSVLYVKSDGVDSPSCGGKTNPYKSVNYALSQLESSLSTDVEVYILDNLVNLSAPIEITSSVSGKDIYIEGFGGNKNIFMNEESSKDNRCFKITGKNVHLKNLTLKGFALKDNASSGGCVYVSDAKLYVNNCTLEDSKSSSNGGAIYVESDASAVLKGCTITGCEASVSGGGIFSSGKLNLNDSVINSCSGNTCGGGIYMSNAECLMEGTSSVENCSATSGKGIYATSNSVIDMKDSAKVVPGTDNLCDVYFDASAGHPSINISGSLESSEKIAFIKFSSSELSDYVKLNKVVTKDNDVSLGNMSFNDYFMTLMGINEQGFLNESVNASMCKTYDDFAATGFSVLTADSIDDLNKISSWVNDGNSMKGKTVKLLKDVIVNKEFVPIGKYSDNDKMPFEGSFDGNNKTVTYNVSIDKDSFSLFQYVKDGTVKNLNATGSITSTSKRSCVAGIAARDEGGSTVENCTSSVVITVSNTTNESWAIGGIVGNVISKDNSVTVKGCINRGNIIAMSARSCGGIVGCGGRELIINCINEGDISGGGAVGGIVGHCSNSNIYNCGNTGRITANWGDGVSYTSGAGGIGGGPNATNSGLEPSIINCFSSGNVISCNSYPNCAGAIFGNYCTSDSSDGCIIEKCYYLKNSCERVIGNRNSTSASMKENLSDIITNLNNNISGDMKKWSLVDGKLSFK